MAHSLSQTEQIGDLHSRLHDNQPPLLPFLRTLLLTLPTDFTDDNTPDDSLYHFLRADPVADQTTLVSNANTLLRFLHPYKSPNPDDPAAKAAAHLAPLITHIKRVLTIPLTWQYPTVLSTCLWSLRSHWPATSIESQTSLHSLYASGRYGSATSLRTPGISPAPSLTYF